MKKLLYIVLIFMALGAILIYELPEKRTIRIALETEVPYDSCLYFFQNKTHWNRWIHSTPSIENANGENEALTILKANNWGGYCTAQKLEKGFLTSIESLENIQLTSNDGGCTIQWESVLICQYPLGRIEGYFEQSQRQDIMNSCLNALDSLLRASYQAPPTSIDPEISIHEE